MLGRLLKADNCAVEIIPTKVLPREIQRRVELEKPAVVFIGILPPGGLVQASYLSKLLRRHFPDLSIVVGYWDEVRKFDKLVVQVHSAGGDYVTTSLRQARSQIAALIPAGAKEEALVDSARIRRRKPREAALAVREIHWRLSLRTESQPRPIRHY